MKIRDYIMRLTLPERIKRQNKKGREEKSKLDRLSDEELLFRYVELSTKYEHQKRFFSLIIVAVLLSCFSNLWGAFWNFTKDILQIKTLSTEDLTAFAIAFFALCLFVSFFLAILILSYLKSMRQTHYDLLMVEEIKKNRK